MTSDRGYGAYVIMPKFDFMALRSASLIFPSQFTSSREQVGTFHIMLTLPLPFEPM